MAGATVRSLLTSALRRLPATTELRLRSLRPSERRRRDLLGSFLRIDARAVSALEGEVLRSGLVDHLAAAERWFERAVHGQVRGRRFAFGGVTLREGIELYSVLRVMRPTIAVETGVCNGASTAFLLLALERNGDGVLHSIDLPEYADTTGDGFWAGKGGAVVPAGREPGWAIPEGLRERWRLRLGASRDELPPLLEEVGSIDFFLHDSEHSEPNMRFELEAAFEALVDGGVLAADDVGWNEAFPAFAERVGRRRVELGGVGYLRR